MKRLSVVMAVVLGIALVFSVVGLSKQDVLCTVTGGLQLGITEQAVGYFPFLEGASKANVGFNVRCLQIPENQVVEASGRANLVIHYGDKDNPNYENFGPVAKWQGKIEGVCRHVTNKGLIFSFNPDIGGNTYTVYVALADFGSPGKGTDRVVMGDPGTAVTFPIIGGNVVYH